MPLGFSNDVSHFAKRRCVGVRDQNVWRMLDQPLNYADDLFAQSCRRRRQLRKALARTTSMIHARVPDVFEVEITDAAGRFGRVNLVTLVSGQQLFRVLLDPCWLL